MLVSASKRDMGTAWGAMATVRSRRRRHCWRSTAGDLALAKRARYPKRGCCCRCTSMYVGRPVTTERFRPKSRGRVRPRATKKRRRRVFSRAAKLAAAEKRLARAAARAQRGCVAYCAAVFTQSAVSAMHDSEDDCDRCVYVFCVARRSALHIKCGTCCAGRAMTPIDALRPSISAQRNICIFYTVRST